MDVADLNKQVVAAGAFNETTLWFEYLLNPSLLEEKLKLDGSGTVFILSDHSWRLCN